jgi:hypothetical protein
LKDLDLAAISAIETNDGQLLNEMVDACDIIMMNPEIFSPPKAPHANALPQERT